MGRRGAVAGEDRDGEGSEGFNAAHASRLVRARGLASTLEGGHDSTMVKNVLAWTCTVLAVFALGPLVTFPMKQLRALDGSSDVTLLVNRSPMLGVSLLALLLGVMVAAAWVIGKIVNKPTGMASAWLIAAWGAWRLSTLDKVFAAASSSNVMWILAIEGLIVSGAGVVLTGLLRGDDSGAETNKGGGRFAALGDASTYIGVAAGVVVGGIAAHIVGYQTLKGQAFAAAAIGSIGAAAASHLTALLLGKKPSALAGAVSVMVLAAIGPVVAQFVYGNGLGAALRAGPGMTGGGGILGFAVPISLDWLGGMLLGLPIGEGWAASMIDKRMQSTAATNAAH